MQGCASLPRTNDRKLVLIVIDGLTPSVFEHAADERSTRPRSPSSPARHVPARSSTFPSLTPVCRILDRDRDASGCPPHPAPRLVPPRREAPGRVRLVLRRAEGSGHAALDHRHDLPHERPPPRLRRDDGVRGARRRGACHGRDQLHLLPRPHRAPHHAARACAARAGRAASSTTTCSSRTRPARRSPFATVRPGPSTSTRPRSAAGSSHATASTSSSTTSPTTTTRRTRSGRTAPR